MNSSDPPAKVPTWIFVAVYLALIATAIAIAVRSAYPWTPHAVVGIVACVLAGAIVFLVPLVMRVEREKNAALDERQQALEALARTVNASAQQIGIATNGLHEIAELAQRNLRHAEHLPHRLQEKIAEFQAQLATASDTEKEELERELLSLRTTESERLESVSQRIAKSAAEWAKLESATHQHLAAANEAVSRLAMGTASAIGKAQAAAEQALAHARIEAARMVGDASGQATRAVEAAKADAVAALATTLAAAAKATAERFTSELNARLVAANQALDEKIARLESISRAPARVDSPPAAASAPPTPARPGAPPEMKEKSPAPHANAPAAIRADSATTPDSDASAAAASRPRKSQREEPLAEAAPRPIAANGEPAPVPPPFADVEEPAPIPVEKIAEITPVAPATAQPFPANISAHANGPAPAGIPLAASAASAGPEPSPPGPAAAAIPGPRKRSGKKPQPSAEPAPGPDLDDTGAGATAIERMLTSDGATRLIVTAYIGIGNRLFIRGNGPGLSWDKGLPLQFVSIGKWRWETNEASSPVEFKLYKNDTFECSALGAQTLDPGHQQEVTATF